MMIHSEESEALAFRVGLLSTPATIYIDMKTFHKGIAPLKKTILSTFLFPPPPCPLYLSRHILSGILEIITSLCSRFQALTLCLSQGTPNVNHCQTRGHVAAAVYKIITQEGADINGDCLGVPIFWSGYISHS